MVPTFKISIGANQGDILAAIGRYIADKPQIAAVEDADKSLVLIFCYTASQAQRYAAEFRATGEVNRALGYAAIYSDRVVSTSECSDESCAHVKQFIAWLLESFPYYHVDDVERGIDVTEEVKRDVDFLFRV